MSWLDRIKDKMQITTDDGVDHFPNWMNASFVCEYKQTEFNFLEVKGGLVKRKKAIGVKYSLELYFQGPDHLNDAEKLRLSTDNTEGPWLIQHPLYDIIVVQPGTLNFDNTGYNVSKITGTVIETMEEPPRNNYADPIDSIQATLPVSTEQTIDNLTVTPVPSDINSMATTAKTSFTKGVPIITDAIDAEQFYNAYNTAISMIDSATATPLLAMRSLIALIQLPGQFKAAVLQRIKVLVDTFDSLRNNILGITSVAGKQIFASQQTAILSAMCGAAASPQSGNYSNSASVFNIIEQISARYQQLIADMDVLQTPTVTSPQSFVVNADMMVTLNQLVNITITNLFTIALGAQQERSIICEADTNVIRLTHRLYGLDALDNNANKLIENNDLSIDELIQIPKDKKIVYYV